jgi:hypothetical protein
MEKAPVARIMCEESERTADRPGDEVDLPAWNYQS